MFLYFETQPTVGPRRFCRLAWGQQVRRGLQQWRLSVQTGKVGTNHYSKDNWFKSADALHSKIKIIEEEITEKGFSRRNQPSLEQLQFPFHEN
ncbi:MAG: hypothetical protein VXW29_05185, partial [SAR324 cluster bacterium]|nr:hypothetical protein [SAR324 cluster bacterium]